MSCNKKYQEIYNFLITVRTAFPKQTLFSIFSYWWWQTELVFLLACLSQRSFYMLQPGVTQILFEWSVFALNEHIQFIKW